MSSVDRRTLIKIAYYYYKLGMTQGEIARKLSMSRQKVNRLSQSLVEEGIVKIKINGYEHFYIELERQLEEKFGLKEAIIVPAIQGEDNLENLGIAGANYLSKVISDGSVLGVSWGRTLSSIASNLSYQAKKNIRVVQLVGGINLKNVSIKAEEITRIIAKKFEGTPYLLYAPAIVRDAEVKKALLSDKSISSIFEMFSECDVALVGIGALTRESTLFKQNYLTPEDFEELKSLHCVGDICSRYYDLNGEPVSPQLNARVMGPELKTLKKIKNVIGVAAGKEKVDAILGALRGGYLNVLITDNLTADAVLEKI